MIKYFSREKDSFSNCTSKYRYTATEQIVNL